jgi:hypothetical protein
MAVKLYRTAYQHAEKAAHELHQMIEKENHAVAR